MSTPAVPLSGVGVKCISYHDHQGEPGVWAAGTTLWMAQPGPGRQMLSCGLSWRRLSYPHLHPHPRREGEFLTPYVLCQLSSFYLLVYADPPHPHTRINPRSNPVKEASLFAHFTDPELEVREVKGLPPESSLA